MSDETNPTDNPNGADTFVPFVPNWLSPASQDAIGAAAPSWLPGYEANVDPDATAQTASGEIEMPPMDVSRPAVDATSGVKLGIPHVPTDAPPTDAEIAAQNSVVPGIGIPASIFDAAAGQFPRPPIDPTQIAPGIDFINNAINPAPATPEDAVGRALAPLEFVQNTINPTGSAEPYQKESQNPYDNPNLSPEQIADAMHRLEQSDPYAAAKIDAARAQKRSDYLADQQRLIDEADRRRVEDNLRIQREATEHMNAKSEQLLAQAAELSSRPIDKDRWWSSRTTGQKIFNVIGALGGALSVSGAAYAGHFGLRNQFLDDMQKQIDDDIDLQKEAITRGLAGVDQQRGIVNEIYKRTGDLYQAGEVARLAFLQSAKGGLQTKMMQLDPRGSQADAIRQNIARIDASIIATVRANNEREYLNKKRELEEKKAQAEIDKLNAETDKLKARGVGAGGSAKAAALDNPLVRGLPPKDRERVVYSPDGKTIRLAASADEAQEWRRAVTAASDAIASTDATIAELLNDPGVGSRIKAGIGLNPEDIAVIKARLATLKPKVAKFESDTPKIPLVEVHAIDAAIDDPGRFTTNTLAQLRAMRNDMVAAAVNRAKSQFGPHDGQPALITADSFGTMPELAPAPDAGELTAQMTSPAVKGDAGYAKPDVGNFAGQLEGLYRFYVETPTIASGVKGQENDGGPEKGQQDYQDKLDELEAAQHDNAIKTSAEVARLVKIKKRTPAQESELAKAKLASAAYAEHLRSIQEYRQKSVAEAQRLRDEKKAADERAEMENNPMAAASPMIGGM